LAFDGTAIFGGPRSKRYALVLEDGKVKEIHAEPDNTGLDGMLSFCFKGLKTNSHIPVSAAEKVLG
jgi:peroxiredoxin